MWLGVPMGGYEKPRKDKRGEDRYHSEELRPTMVLTNHLGTGKVILH